MTFQWTMAVSILYTEVAIVILLLLPIPPTLWRRFFDLRVVKLLSAYGNVYFHMIVSIFVLLFADSLRELRKYSKIELSDMALPQAGHHIHMRQFRAQRNFYIAGGALFLFFVIGRLVSLTMKIAQCIADAEASKRQAMSASRTASSLLSESSKAKDSDSNEQLLKKELKQSNLDYVRLKERYDSLDKEYRSLQDELQQQEVVLRELRGDNESSKDK